MWETSVTTSLTSIRPVSHGSGLDRDTHQHQDARRKRCDEGARRKGNIIETERGRELWGRIKGWGREKRAEMVTRCASHCNHLSFFIGRRSTGWPSPPSADGTLQPAKTNIHLLKRTEHKSCVPKIPPIMKSKHVEEELGQGFCEI